LFFSIVINTHWVYGKALVEGHNLNAAQKYGGYLARISFYADLKADGNY